MYKMQNLYQKLLISSLLIQVMPLATTRGIAPAQAQITPDNTLGVESSQLNQNVLINNILGDKIDGGATRGSNLFHSFSQFNINDGQRVYFANPSGVLNILTRVTGGSGSNIFGTLGVDGAANLFLINPNGILFGQNARLDVGGSFVGTTANRIQFGNQGFFSATNPEAPPLLTINPSALVFNQINPNASIENNSVANLGLDPSNTFTATGLRVPDGNSLLLVGGDIKMNNGRLYAFGGRVELGGLAAPGTVGLNGSGSNLSLSFPDGVARSDVSLSNLAGVGVAASDGGSIGINARNLELAGGSFLYAGIGDGLGTVGSKAGNIDINAQGAVNLDGSYILNNLRPGATGHGGNVKIDAGGVSVKNGAQINAVTLGKGDAGNVTITSRDAVSFDGAASNGNTTSAAFSSVEPGAVGNGGTVNIDARSLSLTNGGQLAVIVREADTSNKLAGGRGDGGTVNVKVRDAVTISGESANGTRSGIFSSLGFGAEGRGGDINIIESGSVSVTNDAQLIASTSGKGDAGSININSRGLVFFDNGINNDTGAFSNVRTGAVGKAGGVNIDAGSVEVKNGAQINAFTRGTGDAGNVTITARDAVVFDGVASNGNPSAVLNTVDAGAEGNGGTVNIDARSLSLTNGGELVVSVRRADTSSNLAGGRGIGGSVNLKVRDAVTISGTDSGIFSSLGFGAVGRGGNININDAGSLSVSDGARLTASTFGTGDAGDITINVRDAVSFDGADNTGVFSNASDRAVGNGGNIKIGARTLSITNGAAIRANSFTDSVKNQATGRAGNIEVNARSIKLNNEGNITATSTSGNGGNITLEIGDLLLLRSNSLISTSTSGAGNGGNITINAPNGFIVGVPNENSDIITNAVTGNGGKVNINAAGIYFLAPLSREKLQRLRPLDLDPRKLQTNDITAISQEKPELSGQVNINTLNSDPNRGLFTLSTGVVEPSTLIASGCGAIGGGGSEFTVTGRGGLPPSPDEPLTSDAVWTDSRLTNIVGENKPKASVPTPSKDSTVEIVPATGWVFNGKGEVTLISNVSNTSPRQIGSSPTCQQR
jgi:filamentous hemagglutinin family protein